MSQEDVVVVRSQEVVACLDTGFVRPFRQGRPAGDVHRGCRSPLPTGLRERAD